ncbi:MAG: hypothetical protein GF308_06375 [Candidatus Heimdallarchaeota archaeon]|nr:hypothetical protein [Candidatus Heimdallarchaeota archaeon]
MNNNYSPRIGFLITHGTDTMSWGLSALRYLLKNLPANVAITGSQVPLSLQFSSSDGYNNLENALKLLTQLSGPEVFVVFNNGQAAFRDSLWKIKKWIPEAFIGDEFAQIALDEIVIHGNQYPLSSERTLDKLYLIRTGGTIEAEKNEEGILTPTANLVPAYLSYRFTNFFKELVPISLMALDSSDLTLDNWKKIANAIANEARSMGYTTFCDNNFEEKVSLISCSPLMSEEEYHILFERAKGVVLSAYGSGTININHKSGRSPLPIIKEAVSEDKIVVLVSHTPIGTQGFIYENAWEAIKCGALPTGDFGVAHSQIKLAYILGHMQIIEEVAKKTSLAPIKLAKLAFLSGINFYSNSSRKRFEKLFGYPIPPFDPFFNVPFKTGLEKIIRYLDQQECQQLTIKSLTDFDSICSNFLTNSKQRNKWAIILKPDIAIGTNNWGELVDAAKNLANLTNELLDWNTIILELTQIDYNQLLAKINDLTGESIGEFLRSFRYVIVEGGRQSLYDSDSFERLSNGKFTKENYLHLLSSLMAARNKPSSCPALFICLGHQGIAETLRNQFIEITENSSTLLKQLSRENPEAAREFEEILAEIIQHGKEIKVIKRKQVNNQLNDVLISEGFEDRFFAVSKNELPETGLKRLVPFNPKDSALFTEILQTYNDFAKSQVGMLESFYPLESLDIIMLHNDEVNEEAILFLNWGLNKISSFIEKYHQLLLSNDEFAIVNSLPFGIEIIGSTLYQTSESENECLTEIAGLVIYYYDPKTNIIKRDYTSQFHPELFEEIRSIHKRDLESKSFVELTDGVKLLLASLQAGFIETQK